MNTELPVVLEETTMGALVVPAGDLPFNDNWPMVGCFGVVALVGDFPSVLLGVRERDEDPDLEKRWGPRATTLWVSRPKDMVDRPGVWPRRPSGGWHHGQRLCLDDIHRHELLQFLRKGEGRHR